MLCNIQWATQKSGPYVQFTVFRICLKKEDRLETDEEFLFLKKMLVFVSFEQSKNYLKWVVI